MKTIIMAGGFGKRAASIDSSIPKPLIQIAGKPVLQWEIECLVQQGYTDIILTVYYMAEKIKNYFGNGSSLGCHLAYFTEEHPLGNAGALFKLWESGQLAGDFLLLNADSMFEVDFNRMVSFHQKHHALATLFTHPNNHPYDSGLIISSNDGIVRQWLTKEDARPQWYKNRVNAGIHIMNTTLLSLTGIHAANIDAGHKIDLDRDVLKPLITSNRVYAYESSEYVKDMGTPERFVQVKNDLESGKVLGRRRSKMQKAIFLDRDGTINKYVGFLQNIDKFELMPGAAEAIQCINDSGYLAIVITNQPVIARGELTVEELQVIHNKMETLLGYEGAYIDAIYYCPHHPDKGFDGEISSLKFDCACRKPKPGMLLQAAQDYNLDLKASWMVGDGDRDIQAGRSVECKTVYISTGEGDDNKNADYTVTSLLEAVKLILS